MYVRILTIFGFTKLRITQTYDIKRSVREIVKSKDACAYCDWEGFSMKYGCHTMHFCCTEAVVKALVWKQLLTMLKQWKGCFLEYRIWTQVWNAESPDWTFRRMHGFSFQFFKVYILSLHTLQVSVDSRQLFMNTVPLVQINEKTFPGITVIKELSLFIYN